MTCAFTPVSLRCDYARQDALEACRAALAPCRGDGTDTGRPIGLRQVCHYMRGGGSIWSPMTEVVVFGRDFIGAVSPDELSPREKARIGVAAWLSQFGSGDHLLWEAIDDATRQGWPDVLRLDRIMLRDMAIVTPRDLDDLPAGADAEVPPAGADAESPGDPRIGDGLLPGPDTAHERMSRLTRLSRATLFLQRWHGPGIRGVLPPEINR